MAPASTLCENVLLLKSSDTCTWCQILSLDPSVLVSQVLAPAGGRTESLSHTIVRFIYLCRMIGERSVFPSFFYSKLFELGSSRSRFLQRIREVDFYNGSTHVGAAALSAPMMLLWCSYVSASSPPVNPSFMSVDRLNSKIHIICRASLNVTPFSLLPLNRSFENETQCFPWLFGPVVVSCSRGIDVVPYRLLFFVFGPMKRIC